MNKDKGGDDDDDNDDDDDDDDDTFEKYTSEWISLVDRGWLFNVRQDFPIVLNSKSGSILHHLCCSKAPWQKKR